FARQAVLFTNAFSNVTWTVPSHATLFTGLFPSSNGAGGAPPLDDRRGFSPDLPTLASVLQARGFGTGAFHFGPTLDARWGFDRGFDVYQSGDFRRDEKAGTSVETTFREAASWLAGRDASKPYFLFVHTFAVHRYGFIALDSAGASSCPPRFDFSLNFSSMTSPADPRCPLARERYAAAVRCADEDFGRLLADLDAAGARDAVVVVLGDHGEALCDVHDRAPLVGHGFPPYEDEIRVPLAIRLPGGRLAGSRRSADASLVDVMPTVLAALGVPPPGGLQGADLLGAALAPERAVFAESDAWQMVREKGFKYVRYRDGHEELFDLAAGTAEVRNAAADAALRAPLDAARARLREHDAAQRIGYHFLARGRRGDRFEIRVESDEPIGYAVSFLTEASDRVVRAPGGKSIAAEFVAEKDGDEDWLAVDEGVPYVGGMRDPRPAGSAPKPLRVSVRRNGRPVPAAELFVGGRPASRDGAFTLDPSRRDADVEALAVPTEAAVVVWRLKGGARASTAPGDAPLRAALQAEGYVP
ncbi:MAG TPA: sulfatase, partial [Elusimicrobiota bacterium]|nr:sulfatase [Elusimicrobiota bacterium]